MSTAVPIRPMTAKVPAALPDWIPSPLYRLTVDQYEAMADSGIFGERNRVHLINGCLVEKMTQHPPHSIADDLCGEALRLAFPPGWYVRPGKPVRIPGLASMPEADRSVARGSIRDYGGRHPGPADLALDVEISESSLDEDRKLAEIYGKAGIPVYWIVNLVDSQVEVYSDPGPSGYRSHEVLAPGHVLHMMIDGTEVGEIPVADILP
jgi:Uma2 family endonuclease